MIQALHLCLSLAISWETLRATLEAPTLLVRSVIFAPAAGKDLVDAQGW